MISTPKVVLDPCASDAGHDDHLAYLADHLRQIKTDDWSGRMRPMKEFIKKVAYRYPLLSKWSAPSYPYKVNPAQLSFLCEAISNTRGSSGSILEIGVAKGDTSVFLLEHLRTTADTRTVYFLDTFAGFTDESINHEVDVRGKAVDDYDAFRYGEE